MNRQKAATRTALLYVAMP